MKYLLIMFSILFSFPATASDDNMKVAEKQTENVYQECHKKYFNENYSLYDDSLKTSLSKINACLKNKLVSEIQQTFTVSQQKIVLRNIDNIEKSTLNFYWDLYNENKFTSDGGTIGHSQNEGALREMFKQLLKDVIYVKLEG